MAFVTLLHQLWKTEWKKHGRCQQALLHLKSDCAKENLKLCVAYCLHQLPLGSVTELDVAVTGTYWVHILVLDPTQSEVLKGEWVYVRSLFWY